MGPTGSGKSRLALYLAQLFDGEIVNADSRQVYRYMDIGTAKPSIHERTIVPHHLFDIINPDEDFSLAQYQYLATEAINDIQKRNKNPFLVGGSGQYIWGILEGWEIPKVPPNIEFRHKLEKEAAEQGGDIIFQKLMSLDPVAAQKIDPRNIRRVIRALEVINQSKTPFSDLQRKKAPEYTSLIIGLTTERPELYRRTDLRVDEMFENGLENEVKRLESLGYTFDLSSMGSIGYKPVGMLLRKEVSSEEAKQLIKTDNHRFIRHQYAWFRMKDPRIHWFDIQSHVEYEIKTLISNFLTSN